VAISHSGKLQIGLAVVLAASWLGIYGWTVLADHSGHPGDYLDDRAFPDAAEPVCADAMAEVESFGSAAAVETIEERADLVDRQDRVFHRMLDALRALPMPAGESGGWVEEWLGDWDTHVDDREAWAARLHRGEDPPFVESVKGTDQVSEAVDGFADVNEMPSCATFNDV